MNTAPILNAALGALLSPLALGVVQRTKSIFAGRSGPPLSQFYRDLAKLFRKGAVYSRTTTWVFRAGPVAGSAAVATALLLIPGGSSGSVISFGGDFVALAFFLTAARFLTVLSALDTGSSFEGMGASREAAFSALAEPVLLVCLAAMARTTHAISLAGIFAGTWPAIQSGGASIFLLVAVALVVLLLAENSRIPVDDPNTHLELTMIHEVMVLDHGGPDLGLILWTASVKFWIFGALVVGLLQPRTLAPWLDEGFFLAGMFVLAVVIGVLESSIARLRMKRVPQFIVGGGAFAIVAMALAMR